ncbi:arabinogalactan protein 20 [Artemisia annua]|uniref:Arabinogalactan protein 20 n=1 Tax=Artemisia annua TaxID=35608 RepID=A0A2U1MVD1_ARTAN|nr:arabinogalactan protein 20 [Artemisia annua]
MVLNRAVAMTSLAVMMVMVLLGCANAQSFAPAPAPTSDGTSVDQGIAYGLMIAALLLTYLIHPMDAFPFGLF